MKLTTQDDNLVFNELTAQQDSLLHAAFVANGIPFRYYPGASGVFTYTMPEVFRDALRKALADTALAANELERHL